MSKIVNLAAARFVAAAQPGDIYYTSWGDDQTNVDFYQVVRKTEKTVFVRRIHSKEIDGNGWAGHCTPEHGKFMEGEPERKIFVTKYITNGPPAVKIERCMARRYENKPVYYSNYH